MSGGKQRKAPFTNLEMAYLKELINEVIHIIECKQTDSEWSRKKSAAWKEITNKFNANPQFQEASQQQLKKLWLNMKARARDAKSEEIKRKLTGGGPYIPDMKPEEDSVLAMIPHIMPSIKINQDSDGKGDTDGDDDEMGWKEVHHRMSVEDSIEIIDDISLSVCNKIDHDYYSPSSNKSSHINLTTTVTASSHSSPSIYSINTNQPPNKKFKTTSTVTASSQSSPSISTIQINQPSNTKLLTTCTVTASSHSSPSVTAIQTNQPSTSCSPARTRFNSKSSHSTIDEYKLKLIENDIIQRELKFKSQQAHQDRMNDIDYKIKELEYEHKKRLFSLIEEEQRNKLNKNPL